MDENSSRDYEDDFLDDKYNYNNHEMVEKAKNTVLATSAATGATGVIPIPFADAPIMIAEQVAMMVKINSIFKFEVKKDILKSLVIAALGISGATVVGKTVASGLLKLFPGAGSVAGAVISGGTGGLITLMMGNAYIKVCEAVKNGELALDELGEKKGREKMKEAFREQIKKNKEEKADR